MYSTYHWQHNLEIISILLLFERANFGYSRKKVCVTKSAELLGDRIHDGELIASLFLDLCGVDILVLESFSGRAV